MLQVNWASLRKGLKWSKRFSWIWSKAVATADPNPAKKLPKNCKISGRRRRPWRWCSSISGRLDSWVVSHSALNISMLCHALGCEFEALVTTYSFSDPSTTSTLSSWFYLVYLIWYYYLYIKFVNCKTENGLPQVRGKLFIRGQRED